MIDTFKEVMNLAIKNYAYIKGLYTYKNDPIKIGDRVKILNNGTAPEETKGMIGEVRGIEENTELASIKIYFEDINDYWFFCKRDIEKIQVEEEE